MSSTGLVDMRGNEISSDESEESGAIPFPGDGESAAKPTIRIEGLIVLAVCNDKVFRQVRLNQKQAQRISNFMQSTCGGGLTLDPQPMIVQKIVKVEKRPPSRWARFRRLLNSGPVQP